MKTYNTKQGKTPVSLLASLIYLPNLRVSFSIILVGGPKISSEPDKQN